MSNFDRLISIMARLRSPSGCPWDKEQTHQSLKPYLVEETYEVLDAIDQNNDDEIVEELGDLLLQVVFHSQIANEEKRFTIDDVAATISDKLIRRHPHVFGNVQADTPDEVVKNWEIIKAGEKPGPKASLLDGIPRHLPALFRAQRLQEKAARVGFDWDNIADV
ncbi:MAG: nucleoside triphosphate pyrophosphohydrolase, partial [Candidatus Latescibacteria bacterium]|nr:nucleoside triphosphate pyrophosphohydrolase [Candidatus Latescibacterota bacterium]